MTIRLDGDMFVAPLDAEYAAELVKHCWRKDSTRYYTKEIDNVLPFVDRLDMALQQALFSTENAYQVSLALEPTGEFDIPLPPGKKLYGYQLADAEFIIRSRNTLIAEEAGTGKSAIMTVAANFLKPTCVLIICPAIAKYNWYMNEWPKWTTLPELTIEMAEGDYFPDTHVVVINYDILDRHKKRLQDKVWDYVIVDESHRIKNEEARRTVMVLGGRLKVKPDKVETYCAQPTSQRGTFYIPEIQFEKRVFASATPMNRPRDLWTMVRACDPTGLGRDRLEFEKRYCAARMTPFGWDNGGADHLEELGGRLRSTFMVRHDADQVLDLPPLREELFLLPPVKIVLDREEEFVHDNIGALLGLASASGRKDLNEDSSSDDFLRLIGEAILDNVPLIGKPDFAPLFSKFSLIRKATGLAKVPYIVDFVNEVSDDLYRPIVVFAYHREVMDELRKNFPESSIVMGGLSATKRGLAIAAFQAGETNPFLGNIDAAGEAVTLTAADLLVFAELDWRGTAMLQARKRIHRISQTKPCSVYYLASAKSFDALVADNAFDKMYNIQETMELRL